MLLDKVSGYFEQNRNHLGLLFLRLIIAADILLSAAQKVVFTETALDHFAMIYNLGFFTGGEMKMIGAAEGILGIVLLTGFYKRVTYSIAFALQAAFIYAISPELIAELKQLNLTLFPYVITLVGTLVLYTARDEDIFFTPMPDRDYA